MVSPPEEATCCVLTETGLYWTTGYSVDEIGPPENIAGNFHLTGSAPPGLVYQTLRVSIISFLDEHLTQGLTHFFYIHNSVSMEYPQPICIFFCS